MKTRAARGLHALALSSVVWSVLGAILMYAQAPLDLDDNPRFLSASRGLCLPNQGNVGRGAFAHWGANGIDIAPLPNAPTPVPSPVWQYTLLPGSQLLDECPICDVIPIPVPMGGTFQLRLIEENPLFATYAVENIEFKAESPSGSSYKVAGRGLYHFGGEVGLIQEMRLEAAINDGITNTLCYFSNKVNAVDRLWPMIQVALIQTNGTDVETFHMEWTAAPLRQVWFSTASDLTSMRLPAPTNTISAGDLISSTGRIVRRNEDLMRNLGIVPTASSLGLDALDVLINGEVVFSLEEDVLSGGLGQLQHGDLLSDQGRRVATNRDLTQAFMIMPPVADFGLDAVQVRDDGEIWFSIETPVFSGIVGMLGRGDLLSSRGLVVRSNAQLLSRFHPPPAMGPLPFDFGLDAFYIWPSQLGTTEPPNGEIWFSLEEGFVDGVLGRIQPGDLLSDQGYIVYTNLALISAFAPKEELADFGLDSLYVLFGTTPQLGITRSDGGIVIEWDAPLGVVQEADSPSGPWQDVLPVGTSSPYMLASPSGPRFFRLREP